MPHGQRAFLANIRTDTCAGKQFGGFAALMRGHKVWAPACADHQPAECRDERGGTAARANGMTLEAPAPPLQGIRFCLISLAA
ncbi:hypothetical protein [Noviherbaspirillum humi]|uniref:hypothetical protein n=1 Tax=Noviherbaspirillum humi TaxID=1688639 RepID=UPI0015954FCE|nr:hypothetical protein [Noviherbaspirillum humi]